MYPVDLRYNNSSIFEVKFNIQTIIDALHPMEGDRYNITVALITDSKGSVIDSPSVLRYRIEIPSMTSSIVPTMTSILTIRSSNSRYESIFSSDSRYDSSSFQFSAGSSSGLLPTSSTLPSSTFSHSPPLLILTEGAQRPPDQHLLYFIVLSVTTAVLLVLSIVALLAVVMVVFLRRQKLMSRDCKGKTSAVNPITTEG